MYGSRLEAPRCYRTGCRGARGSICDRRAAWSFQRAETWSRCQAGVQSALDSCVEARTAERGRAGGGDDEDGWSDVVLAVQNDEEGVGAGGRRCRESTAMDLRWGGRGSISLCDWVAGGVSMSAEGAVRTRVSKSGIAYPVGRARCLFRRARRPAATHEYKSLARQLSCHYSLSSSRPPSPPPLGWSFSSHRLHSF